MCLVWIFCCICIKLLSLIWNPEKKTVFGKNGTTWCSILLGTLVIGAIIGIFFHTIREVKKARQNPNMQGLPAMNQTPSLQPSTVVASTTDSTPNLMSPTSMVPTAPVEKYRTEEAAGSSFQEEVAPLKFLLNNTALHADDEKMDKDFREERSLKNYNAPPNSFHQGVNTFKDPYNRPSTSGFNRKQRNKENYFKKVYQGGVKSKAKALTFAMSSMASTVASRYSLRLRSGKVKSILKKTDVSSSTGEKPKKKVRFEIFEETETSSSNGQHATANSNTTYAGQNNKDD